MHRRVFTNGCFDVLHAGHVRLLTWARAQGDHLFVAVDSDERVRMLKGDGRPICQLPERVALLEALRCVDEVGVFGTDREFDLLLRRYRPDVLVKGPDYGAAPIRGSVFVRDNGGEVLVMPSAPEMADLSTTAIVRRIIGLR